MLRIYLYHLYMLQLENYDLRRYFRALAHQWLAPEEKMRQEIRWSTKIKIILAIALILQVLAALYLIHTVFLLIAALVVFFHIPAVFYALAVIIFFPIDYVLKQTIIGLAKRKITLFPDLKIIGITGSYGKTTMKEILATLLAEHYTVLKTPDNINTLIGIARLILKKLTGTTDIFIVEMGAYERGDIRTLCEITPPRISIITGINEAHLERFGSIENTIAAKFEIAHHAFKKTVVILNEDDENIRREWQAWVDGRPAYFYTATNAHHARYRIGNLRYAENGLVMSFDLLDKEGEAE